MEPISMALAGGSLVSGLMGMREAKKSGKAQRALMAEQAALLRQQAAQGAEMYARYKSDFLPFEQDYLDTVRAGVQPDFQYEAARSRLGVGRAYDQEQGRLQREFSRLGINPNSPRFQSMMRETSLRRASDAAMAGNLARRAASEKAQTTQFSRLGSAVDLGRGLVPLAQGSTNSASAGLGNQASAYGNMSSNSARDAASAFGAAGYLAQRAFRPSDTGGGLTGGGYAGTPMGGLDAIDRSYGISSPAPSAYNFSLN